MIQLQRPQQFTTAARRAARERQHVRRRAPNLYEVTNPARPGHSYLVRFTKRGGKVFAHCDCEAGHPTKGQGRVPLICKHLFAACVFVKAVAAMRRGH